MHQKAKIQKFYAVSKGRKPGIYLTWAECQEQTNKFRGAKFVSFETHELCEEWIQQQKNNDENDKINNNDIFTKKKFYGVFKGKNPGIFSSWEECKNETQKFKGAQFKSFDTKEQCQQWMQYKKEKEENKNTEKVSKDNNDFNEFQSWKKIKYDDQISNSIFEQSISKISQDYIETENNESLMHQIQDYKETEKNESLIHQIQDIKIKSNDVSQYKSLERNSKSESQNLLNFFQNNR